jgi:lysozyme family protein
MSLDFDAAFQRLIGHEGGYVADPNDPGGETKYGISKKAYPNLDIRNLTLSQAKEIYRRDYWDVIGDDADPAIKFQVFDFAVNSGPGTAIRKLQSAIGVADDGIFGPRSRAALAALPVSDVLMRYLAERLAYLPKLKNWPHHGAGWANRIAANLRYAAQDNEV